MQPVDSSNAMTWHHDQVGVMTFGVLNNANSRLAGQRGKRDFPKLRMRRDVLARMQRSYFRP
jgi:hypothetical protein